MLSELISWEPEESKAKTGSHAFRKFVHIYLLPTWLEIANGGQKWLTDVLGRLWAVQMRNYPFVVLTPHWSLVAIVSVVINHNSYSAFHPIISFRTRKWNLRLPSLYVLCQKAVACGPKVMFCQIGPRLVYPLRQSRKWWVSIISILYLALRVLVYRQFIWSNGFLNLNHF